MIINNYFEKVFDTVQTQNKTLRRKNSITTGRTDSTATFNPSDEWEQFDSDTFDGLGSHAGDGGTAPAPDPAPEPLEPLVCGADKIICVFFVIK